MQLEHSFTVPVDIEKAWEVLLDIETVAPCMPGAALDSIDGDSFTGRVKIKLGPVNLTYKGAASFIEKDATAHRAVIDANGKDSRGNGTAAAKVIATLVSESPTSTRVEVLTDLNITGKPAQFGRGVMADVGNKLIGQFASCLEGKLAGTPDEPTVAQPVVAAPEAPDAAAAPVQAGAATAGEPAGAPVPAPAAAPVAAPRSVRQPAVEPEPIDLLDLAGGSVLTRAAPIAGGLLALLIVLFLVRRRR